MCMQTKRKGLLDKQEGEVQTAYYSSSFGCIKIAYQGDALTEVAFVVGIEQQEAPLLSVRSALSDRAFAELEAYFAGKRKQFTLPLLPKGTAFQQKVWNALLAIPYGQTRSYKQIASAIGQPKACRAVGMANNKNPLAIVIPCHRVIGSNGRMVGYASGLDRKANLLQLEGILPKR